MLSAYPKDRAKASPLASHSWIDLLDPTAAERSAFETAFGLRVPTNDELGEIEATSRLQSRERRALYDGAADLRRGRRAVAALPDRVRAVEASADDRCALPNRRRSTRWPRNAAPRKSSNRLPLS